jgi:hypothetical protein
MNEKITEQKILAMLEDGSSYSDIEAALGVSSKTISKVNKLRKEQESANDGTLEESYRDNFPENKEETTYFPVIRKHSYPDIRQKINCMEPRESGNYRQESKSQAEIHLEELRLRQDHEFRLQQFEWNKQKEEKELTLKELEIQQKQQALELEQNRTSEKYREYIFKLKNIASRCEPGIWDYDDMVDLYNEAEKLLRKAEKFFIIHGIEFENSLYKRILDAICESLDELTDRNEEEEEVEWEFDDQFDECMVLAEKL